MMVWPWKTSDPLSNERIYCEPIASQVRELFVDAGFRLTRKPERAGLIWLRTFQPGMSEALAPWQLLNQIPKERFLTDKGQLAERLNSATEKGLRAGRTVSVAQPPTFHYRGAADREAGASWLSAQAEGLWLVKPTRQTKGRGFHLLKDRQAVRDLLSDRDEPAVVQRYVADPLLLNGRKFELRYYCLVASVKPLVALLFPEATIRLNALPYTLEVLDNPLVHFSNAFRQTAHPEFDPTATLRWTYPRFLEHFSALGGEKDVQSPLEQTVGLVRAVMDAVGDRLAEVPNSGLFCGLYGIDVLIDQNQRAWLLEVQPQPSLKHVDHEERRLIPSLAAETVRTLFAVRRWLGQGRERGIRELVGAEGRSWRWVVGDGGKRGECKS